MSSSIHTTSEPVIRDLPDYCQTLSWKVYQILEDIGANVKQRKLLMDNGNDREILQNALFGPSWSFLDAGSFYEGTMTFGMRPDQDFVRIINDLPVVTDPADHPFGTCVLLIQDITTHPGYCKLQLVENGRPIFGNHVAVTERHSACIQGMLRFNPDKNNRLVCTFNPPIEFFNLIHGRHGPALFRSESHSEPAQDVVFALQSKSWPRCASEWLTRHRHFSWPSTEMINECSTFGCLFVPVGHTESDEQNKQWRISLTRQERLLVTSFNSVQLKCYILLKIIKKDLIAPYIPDSLTSYHIKTCMLYLIENTSPEFWRPDNLLGCVAASLKLLSYWTEIGYCPNYFIPAENMFDRHVYGNVRQQLHQRLQHLISANFQFLVHIQTERIGEYLQIHCIPSRCAIGRACYLQEVKKKKNWTEAALYGTKHRLAFTVNRGIVKNALHSSRAISVSSLFRKLKDIRNNRLLSGFTETQTLILPYIQLHTMSSLISLAVFQRKPRELIWRYLVSERWHELSLQSDSFSPKLKQATFMYMRGYYYPSLDILSSLSSLVRFTLCLFDLKSDHYVVHKALSIQESSDIAAKELFRKYCVPCVEFTPTEKDMVPTALSYEMIRTEGQNVSLPRDMADIMDSSFGNWAFIDGQFLLYFLLYLNHTQLSMESHACAAIDNMEWMLNTQTVSHKETCLNLLGWTYKEQGRVERAMECYRKSIEIKPSCNAAFWHIKDIEDMNNQPSLY